MLDCKILDLIYKEPYKIGHFLGFKDLTLLHNSWLKSFLTGTEDQTLLAHRGSYKTTVLALFLAIHAIKNPNENVMFFRKTDNDVAEVMRQVAKILRTGCMQEIAARIFNRNLVLLKSTDSEINTNLQSSAKGTSQIVGLGIKTSITGKHSDIVITDDIVNVKDRVSRAEREQIKMQYMELQNIKNRGGRFINTGTPWHKDDAISLMPNVTKYDCYQTGLIDRETLERLRSSMSDSLFAANYELKHIADRDVMFTNPQFTTDAASIYNGLAHIDAAYGGNDWTAYTIMKERPDGKITAFGKLWHKHVDSCLNEVALLHSFYRAGRIYNENNADKGYLKKEIEKLKIPCAGYHETTNKYIKISTYLKGRWADIYWLEDTDPEYIDMILDYNEHAEHDDAPDSAASLIRQLSKKGWMY